VGQEFKPVYEFGPFRLDVTERVLSRDSRPVPLAPKTFDLLLVLVDHHGHLIDKERLLQLVWPDTTVEESNLSYNVSVLRKTLGESASGPFIETVPKRGYRFVAPVRVRNTGPQRTRQLRTWVSAGLAVAAMAGTAVWLSGSGGYRPEPPLESSPLTSYAGSEVYPDLSPDGNQVAFSWNGAEQQDFRIYVQQVGNSAPVRLTEGPGNDLSPAWSPDGRTIAFLRLHPGNAGASVYLFPFPGGPERKLVDLLYVRPGLNDDRYGTEIAWHPGGQWLAITDRMTPGASPGLCLVSVSTREKRELLPPPGTPGVDLAAAFRPDGRYLVFIRVKAFGKTDLYGVPVSDSVKVEGTPIELTSHPDYRTVSPVWTPDGKEILFLAGPFTGDLNLWRMPGPKPGTARRLALNGYGAVFLSAPRKRAGSKLRALYVKSLHDSNVWRIDETRPSALSSAEPVLNSTREDSNAQFSPDGSRIVFASSRSGSQEIWVSRSDGSNPMQLSFIGGAQVGGPAWAPDSERIAFHARPQGSADLYVVNANGGPVQRLTSEPKQEGLPAWSRDGRWIYFSSNRLGPTDIWKMPSAGGPPIQVTNGGGGNVAQESIDGEWLYYSLLDRSIVSLWKMSAAGGEATEILPSLANVRAFCVVEAGIYFIPAADSKKHSVIRFLDFSGSHYRDVSPITKTVGYGISVFPATRSFPRTILYGQVDQDGSDLMLLDDLRAR